MATYYASPSGSGGSSGSSVAAPTTLASACARAAAGDEIQCRAGDHGQVAITNRTISGVPVRIRNFGTEVATASFSLDNSSGFDWTGFGGQAAFTVRVHGVYIQNCEKLNFTSLTMPSAQMIGATRRRLLTWQSCRFGGAGVINVLLASGGHTGVAAPTDITIRGCTWDTWSDGDGLQIYKPVRLKVEDNVVRNMTRGTSGTHSDWIQCQGPSDAVQIRRNFVYKSARGMLFQPDQKPGGNTPSSSNPYTGAHTNLVIENNVIDTNGNDFGMRLYGCPGAKIINNTVWGGASSETDSKNLDIRYVQGNQATAQASINLILVNNIARSLTIQNGVTFSAERANIVKTATIYQPGGAASSYTLHSTSRKGTTPNFKAPTADPPDFHLVSGFGVGSGINGTVPGTSTTVPTVDRDNRTRTVPYDIGGYESDGTSGAPPAGQTVAPLTILSNRSVGEPTLFRGDASTPAENITVDATSVDHTGSADLIGTAWSWTHVCSGTNRFLFAHVAYRRDGTGGNGLISAMTYNGIAMTQLDTVDDGSMHEEVWYLVAPAAGSHTIALTMSSASGAKGATFLGLSLNGVKQTASLGPKQKANATSAVPSVAVTSAAGELVVDFVYNRDGSPTLTVGAGQTSRAATEAGASSSDAQAAISTEPGATSVTMSWTLSSSVQWGIIAVPVRPVPASGGGGSTQTVAPSTIPSSRMVGQPTLTTGLTLNRPLQAPNLTAAKEAELTAFTPRVAELRDF